MDVDNRIIASNQSDFIVLMKLHKGASYSFCITRVRELTDNDVVQFLEKPQLLIMDSVSTIFFILRSLLLDDGSNFTVNVLWLRRWKDIYRPTTKNIAT